MENAWALDGLIIPTQRPKAYMSCLFFGTYMRECPRANRQMTLLYR